MGSLDLRFLIYHDIQHSFCWAQWLGGDVRAWIYDKIFKNLSSGWYETVIDYLPANSHVLDVGVGTGTSLLSQLPKIREKNIQWMGIDINTSYLKACQEKIDEMGAQTNVSVREQSIYDFEAEEKLDAVYFSASFMLLPDQQEALLTAMKSLKEGGVICFTQTFEVKPAPVMEKIKPLLKRITTVEFGVVTYLDAFVHLLSSVGLEVSHNQVMKKQGPREMRFIMAQCSPAV